MKRHINLDGPVISEVRTGLQRMRVEWQRMVKRVRLQRQLKRIDREEDSAVREVEYQSDTLFKAQANLTGLQASYFHQRFQIIEALREANRADIGSLELR